MSIQNTKSDTKSAKKIKIYSSTHSSQTCKKLYLNERTADVHFTFDSNNERRIAAHKNILATGSSVFELMFYGSMAEEGDVKIMDASIDGFKEFLQFFYNDKVELTMENVGEVMHLAHKYNVDECLSVCDKMLEQHAALENLCSGLQLAITYDRKELKENYLKKISEQPDVLASDGFRNCSQDVLKLLLTTDNNWKFDAKQLFDACMIWAKNACDKNELDASVMENRRKQLGDCLCLLQFDAMSQQQISQCILNYKGFFNCEELEDIITLTMSDVPIEVKTFKSLSRISVKPWNGEAALICSRVHNPSQNKNYVNELESISFQTNKKMLLGAIGAHQVKKSDPSYYSNKMSGFLMIFETTSNQNSEKCALLLKQQINIAGGDGTNPLNYIKLSKAIIVAPYKIYELRIVFSTLWKCQTFYTNSYYKPEVQLDEDIKISFEKNPNLPYDNCSFGIISDLYFNRLDQVKS